MHFSGREGSLGSEEEAMLVLFCQGENTHWDLLVKELWFSSVREGMVVCFCQGENSDSVLLRRVVAGFCWGENAVWVLSKSAGWVLSGRDSVISETEHWL